MRDFHWETDPFFETKSAQKVSVLLIGVPVLANSTWSADVSIFDFMCSKCVFRAFWELKNTLRPLKELLNAVSVDKITKNQKKPRF